MKKVPVFLAIVYLRCEALKLEDSSRIGVMFTFHLQPKTKPKKFATALSLKMSMVGIISHSIP